jgi:type IV pilus assembly protein PilA
MTSIAEAPNEVPRSNGLSVLELMIIIAVLAVTFSLALPVYERYSIQSKLGEAVSTAIDAKTSVALSCAENPGIGRLSNSAAGYTFISTRFVRSIRISGSCKKAFITIRTLNTGVKPDIVLVLAGAGTSSHSNMDWNCSSNALEKYLPDECRG